jgi:uncharacterized membrane protein
MKPELLHPAIVHIPLGIAVVLPILCLTALWLHFQRRDESAVFARFWAGLMVCLIAASVGAFIAHETGEAGEQAIGKFMPEGAIELHEKYSKIFSALLYAATLVGALTIFLRGHLKGYAILAVTLLCSAALFAGILTGNAGGELVYKHKAANYLNVENGTHLQTPAKIPKTEKEN